MPSPEAPKSSKLRISSWPHTMPKLNEATIHKNTTELNEGRPCTKQDEKC